MVEDRNWPARNPSYLRPFLRVISPDRPGSAKYTNCQPPATNSAMTGASPDR